MSRRVVGPFNRVEGDLEVKLEIDGDRVTEASVVSPLYRGFEQMLQGRDPFDALVCVPRVCGICSVSQSVAAAQAIAAVQGVASPPNGELARNLILANENVADHLIHFYMFFMPDFAREVYRREPWFEAACSRFKAVEGKAASEALKARAEFLHLMGLLAGKWPHSLALQPGGTTRAIEAQKKARIQSMLFALRQFLEGSLFGDSLENVIALDSAQALDAWRHKAAPDSGDFHHFLHIADALVVAAMEHWVKGLRPKEPFCFYAAMPQEAQGFGMIEAARGSLGQWVKVKKGRILNYQIIAPTTRNFSPCDTQGVPGALEQALVDAPVRAGVVAPVAVQHIVRSFDPCMVCTVH